MSKANEKRAREMVDALPWHGCKPMCGACRVTLDKALAAALDEAECRALLSLARWAKPNESASSNWSQGYNRALKDVVAECKWRAKGKA